ncbi:MAG TPA: histidine phosphatase family protein [Oligoflexus sp.]|uniref:histidine phosphatase family protein n=1 Tax=Oligoflexus sp. TaxID=1971216 RepID=UPI002D496857|nr:histidine phosphatase family protein [Oligoflexus sp.]HYX38040.1 histidine phosphatase family protein [Oligoflexus sp.]
MGSLYLVRHGQASFGEADYDALSPRGQEQSQVLGQMLAGSGLRFDRILQGGMKRHTETARLCLAQMSDTSPPETAAWLNEFDHQAVMRGLHPDFADPAKVQIFLQSQPEPTKAFHKEFEKAMQRWMHGAHDADYPESYAQFKQRCRQGVQNLLRSCAAESNVLLFTSGGPIACLMQLALDLSDVMMLRLNGAIVNASVSRLPFKADLLFVSYFNDHAHFGKTPSPLLTFR